MFLYGLQYYMSCFRQHPRTCEYTSTSKLYTNRSILDWHLATGPFVSDRPIEIFPSKWQLTSFVSACFEKMSSAVTLLYAF